MLGDESSPQDIKGDFNAQARQNSVASVNNSAFNPTLTVNVNGQMASDAISKTTDTKVASHSENKPILHLPPRNPDFIGRQEILTSLYDTFIAGKSTAQAISGLGGIGKTQIALAFAYDHLHDYQFIFWTKADQYESLVSDFVIIAELLDLPEKNAPEQSFAVNAVKRWLSAHKNWLLILDNADDATVVRNFIPTIYEGHILLTTRAASLLKIAKTSIKPWTPEEGARFLLSRVGILQAKEPLKTIADTELQHAKAISDIMGGLPLALEQAGAYIDENGCRLADYLKLYKVQHDKLLNWRSDFDPDQKTVTTTWLLSFEKVKQNPAAAELLEFFSFLHPDTIFAEIVTIASPFLSLDIQAIANDQFTLNQAISELRKYSLIHRTPDSSAISIHRLVQTVIKDRMDKNKQIQWVEITIKAINQALPDLNFEAWPQYQRLLTHAQTCIELITQWNITLPEAARLLNVIGKYLCERANYTEAQPLLDQALELSEQELGDNHPDVADILNNLVELYRRQGKYIQALPLCQRALAIQKHAPETNQIKIASSLNNLARLHWYQRKDIEAEQFYLQALTLRKQKLGDNHPDVAESLNDLGALYSWMKQEEKSKKLYQQALTLRKLALGESHPDVAISLNNLANCYSNQGRYVEAEQLHQQALTLRKLALGESHPDVADSMGHLANCYNNQGRYSEAEQLFLQTLTLQKLALGESHPDIADSLNDLAHCYVNQIKYVDATLNFKNAKNILANIFGEDSYQTADSLEGLAIVHFKKREYIKSKQIFEQALTLRQKALGDSHPSLTKNLEYLALINQITGNYNKAIDCCKKAMTIYKQTLVPDHLKIKKIEKLYDAIQIKIKPQKSKRKKS